MVSAWLVFLACATVVAWLFHHYVVRPRHAQPADPSDVPARPARPRPRSAQRNASNPGPTRDDWRE